MTYELSNVVNFLTSYDKKKSNMFRDVLRYLDYRRMKSNYSLRDLDKRPTYNLLSEFMYNYQVMDRLLQLSEDKDFNFISINMKNVIHNNENELLTNDYDIYILKIQLPNRKMTISWDTVLKEVEFHVNGNQIYTVSGDSNDYSGWVLEIVQYVFDKILDNYWDIDIKELNKSTISIINIKPSSFKMEIEHVVQNEFFSIDNEGSRTIYIDGKVYAVIVGVKGCICVNKVYYTYECNLIIDYIDYYTKDKTAIFHYIYKELESKREIIKEKLKYCIFCIVSWNCILTL